jgi:glycosyltransferase involved in cell wall biosynthesis
MPVYNAQEYVDRAIDSVLAQTYPDFEFVIVNDGSTDNTLVRLQEHAANDRRIRVLSRPNTGIVGAENDGIELARGKYIARIDADDWCDQRRFEIQVDRMEQGPELVALGTAVNIVDTSGDPLGVFPVPLTHGEIEERHLRGLSSIHHPSVMMRAEAVRKVGGYREVSRPADDFDLWMRLGEIGKLANLPDCLVTKRQTVDGIVGSTLGTPMGDAIQRILEDTWRRRRLPGKPTLPQRTVLSRSDLYRQWAWMALEHGHRRVARKYAVKSVCRQPYHPKAWRAVLCAMRGH